MVFLEFKVSTLKIIWTAAIFVSIEAIFPVSASWKLLVLTTWRWGHMGKHTVASNRIKYETLVTFKVANESFVFTFEVNAAASLFVCMKTIIVKQTVWLQTAFFFRDIEYGNAVMFLGWENWRRFEAFVLGNVSLVVTRDKNRRPDLCAEWIDSIGFLSATWETLFAWNAMDVVALFFAIFA